MDAGAPPHPDALVWRLPGCADAFREAVDAAARATAIEPRRRRTTSSSGMLPVSSTPVDPSH
jgi:hypothetical protein